MSDFELKVVCFAKFQLVFQITKVYKLTNTQQSTTATVSLAMLL